MKIKIDHMKMYRRQLNHWLKLKIALNFYLSKEKEPRTNALSFYLKNTERKTLHLKYRENQWNGT